MKIRTITEFIPLTWPFDEGTVVNAARFLNTARRRLSQGGFDVQSVCLATPPFLDVVAYPDPELLLEYGHKMEDLAKAHHIDFISIGPVVATTPHALLMSIHALPQLISETEKIISGVLFADEFSGVNMAAVYAFAKTVQEVAQNGSNGMGNLRLAALANVPPNMPTPHVAYHHGGRSCFTIAVEAADFAVTAINNTRSINQAQEQLIKSIESTSVHILEIVDTLVDDYQIRFKGIDFSFAPFPTQAGSIGAAIENLGVESFGGSGTLFAVSFLTNAIRQANLPHIGFSGVMLPILEDSVLSQRAAEGRFSVNDLLLYSAICNAGLDIIPIPGNTPANEMGAIFLDMAALAISIGRPISARLMPMPGLSVGDKVLFDSGHLSSSRVLPVKNLGAKKLFERDSFLGLGPLPPRQRSTSEIYPSVNRL